MKNTDVGTICQIERPLLFGETKLRLPIQSIDGSVAGVEIVLGEGRLSTKEIIAKMTLIVQNLEQALGETS